MTLSQELKGKAWFLNLINTFRKALRKAATIASQSDVGSELSWLLGTEGSTFFLTELWTLSDRKAGAGCGLTSAPVSLSPVTQIIRFYRDSMLQSALDTVICPTSSSQISKVLPVLSAVSRSNEMVGSLTGDRHDSVADWWTSLLKCTANWSLNKMDEAEQSYPDIDCLPLPYQVIYLFPTPPPHYLHKNNHPLVYQNFILIYLLSLIMA